MPYLSIQTNQGPDQINTNELLRKASLTVAEILGKPESYVMVALPDPVPMMFAGSSEPLAYLELKSIGLPDAQTSQLSQSLCALISDQLGIDQNRVYIEFSNAPGNLWGWDGGTF
ncbi:MAG: phenylpyruvate tautomerase MIF-related protein [Gammaproteobacteria bacterium]|nr:phenylpyruvate tautomerase MIF-related protein [Gammaproteobacteria bacterium]MDH5800736.1 phenylpyruvate tautomerase MIF-related protein [Gammaproteobacteria bacterium]